MTISANFPALKPSLLLDFANVERLDPRITFTRASNATYFDANGVLQTAGSGVARFDHSPTTLQSLGLLIEEQRTNLALQSGWAGATTGTPGTVPSPWAVGFGAGTETTLVNSIYGSADGAQAVRFNADSGERVFFQQTISVTSGVQYALSAYLEQVSGSVGDLLLVNNGTATVTQNTFVQSPSTPGRYTALFTANSTGTVNIRVGVGCSTVVGSIVSATLSRPQFEAGAFATSYIPTTTAAATRSADVASMTGTNFSSWYNQNNSTMYVQFSPVGTTATSDFGAFSVDNGTFGRGYAVLSRTGIVRFSRRDATGQVATNINYSGTSPKAITTLSVDSANRTVNGGAINLDSTVLSLTDMTTLRIGFNNITGSVAVNYLNGHIQRLSCYPILLSNDQLQALTR